MIVPTDGPRNDKTDRNFSPGYPEGAVPTNVPGYVEVQIYLMVQNEANGATIVPASMRILHFQVQIQGFYWLWIDRR